MNEYTVKRITFSKITIKANSYKDAEDMISEIDGNDDNWDYYNEEFFLWDKTLLSKDNTKQGEVN